MFFRLVQVQESIMAIVPAVNAVRKLVLLGTPPVASSAAVAQHGVAQTVQAGGADRCSCSAAGR